MKKLFKAALSLAIGCAMLQASAFAAINAGTSTVDTSDSAAFEVTVNGVEGQSTILVTKSAERTEGNYTIPANLSDSDIVYIDQLPANTDRAEYSFSIGERAQAGDTLYFFAGGTNENSAVLLSTYEIPSGVSTITATFIIAENNGDTAFLGATGGEYGSAFQVTFVRPDGPVKVTDDAVFGITANGIRKYTPKQERILEGLSGTVTLNVSFLNGATGLGSQEQIASESISQPSIILRDLDGNFLFSNPDDAQKAQ